VAGVAQDAKEGERSFGSLRSLRTRILIGCSVPEWELLVHTRQFS